MTEQKKLLEKRKESKNKKPIFRRKDIHKKSKIGKAWRKAKGLQNKQRL